MSLNGPGAEHDLHSQSGDIQQLAADGSTWNVIGKTKDAWFLHRMLPLSDPSLVSVGCVNMEETKYLEPELVSIR